MAEIIDYLLFFWLALVASVCALGSLYERQAKTGSKKQKIPAEIWQKSFSNDTLDHPDNWSSNRRSSSHYKATNNFELFGNESNQRYRNYSNEYQRGTINYDNHHQLYPHNSHNQPKYQKDDYHNEFNDNKLNNNEDLINQTEFAIHQSRSNLRNFSMSPRRIYSDQNLNDGSIPVATGFNSDCVEWVNNILYLFYTQSDKYGPLIIESIYRSLNEKLSSITSSSVDYADLIVDFTGIDRYSTSRPELTNIRTETESERSVSAICKIYNKRIVFDLSIQRARFGSIGRQDLDTNHQINETINNNSLNEVAHFEVTLENLEGKLKSMAMLSDKLIVIQFMEKPDTKILLKQKYHQDGQSVRNPLINEDILVNMILQTITQVVVDLYFGDDIDFPKFKPSSSASPFSAIYSTSGYKNKLNALKGSASEIKRQIKQDFLGALTLDNSNKDRKIFVKIIRGRNINYNQNVTCILELNLPHQQILSSTRPNSSNPNWDEHFLFDINDKSSELTIELWDSLQMSESQGLAQPVGEHKRTKSMSSLTLPFSLNRNNNICTNNSTKRINKNDITKGAKFLGLVKVHLDDLRRKPVQKVNLPLVSSDGPSSTIGGEIQLELLFLEHSIDQPSSISTSLQKSGSSSSLGGRQARPSSPSDVVSVERKLTSSGYVITTTTITKPLGSQRLSNQSPTFDRPSATNDLDSAHQTLCPPTGARESSPATPTSNLADSERASSAEGRRSRSRSRSILRAIKKRFSFSRSRSLAGDTPSAAETRSLGLSGLNVSTAGLNDALSTGSSDLGSTMAGQGGGGRAKSAPASRKPSRSELPAIVINKGRPSDTTSAFSFEQAKSQLVLECEEPIGSGQFHHYALNDNDLKGVRRRWRKNATKLHLFNDHQFVACRLAGSATCHLCGRVFSRRPGKQGYRCRNCHLLSHKQCHVKVDHNCPYATRDGLKLEFIDAEPPACLLAEQQISEQSERNRRLINVKSVSVDTDDR